MACPSRGRDEAFQFAGQRLLSGEPLVSIAIDYARTYGISYAAARGRLKLARDKLKIEGVESLPDRVIPVDGKLFQWITSREQRLALNEKILKLCPSKGLILNDLHIPKTNWNAAWQCIEAHQDAQWCVLNGDTYGCDNLKFYEHKTEELSESFERAREFVEKLLQIYEYVFMSLGNHEDWFAKALLMAQWGDQRLSEIMRLFLKIIKCKENLVDLSGKEMQAEAGYGFLLKAGECAIAHPSCFSSIPGRSAQWTKEYLENWEEEFGIENFTTVIIGHTHRVSNQMIKKRLHIEGGCLCYPHDYNLRGKVVAANRTDRWYAGCSYVTLDKQGRVDPNKTNYWLAENPF
jgi:predicted phosphodiesterase